ncbi:MAG: hypothetical protein ABDH21_00180 [bacterium]
MSFIHSVQPTDRYSWYSYGPTISSLSINSYNQLLAQVPIFFQAFGVDNGLGFSGFGFIGKGFSFSGIYNSGIDISYNSLTPIYKNSIEKQEILQTGRMFDYKFSSVDGRVQEGSRVINTQFVGRRDPVIIDVDGDGKATVTDTNYEVQRTTHNQEIRIGRRRSIIQTIETTQIVNRGKENGIQFDINGDGIPDRTQWVKAKGDKTDAFVVYLTPEQRRLLQEGKYDQIKLDGRHLMTETGINGEQNKYKSGYEKMRDLFDKNGDGVITGDELKNVYIWQDKNGDGKVDPGELKSAAEWNIKQFDTNKESYTRKVGETYNYKQELAGFDITNINISSNYLYGI